MRTNVLTWSFCHTSFANTCTCFIKINYRAFQKQNTENHEFIITLHRAFQGFGQAKFAYGGSIYTTTPAASKDNAQFKSGQIWFENNHLVS